MNHHAPRRLDDFLVGIGTAFTFVVNGCAVALTRWNGWFEIIPHGSIDSRNAARIGDILQAVLETGWPVTLVLEDLRAVDERGAQVLDDALSIARAAGVEWTVGLRPTSDGPLARSSCA